MHSQSFKVDLMHSFLWIKSSLLPPYLTRKILFVHNPNTMQLIYLSKSFIKFSDVIITIRIFYIAKQFRTSFCSTQKLHKHVLFLVRPLLIVDPRQLWRLASFCPKTNPTILSDTKYDTAKSFNSQREVTNLISDIHYLALEIGLVPRKRHYTKKVLQKRLGEILNLI